jgi:cyclic pyranopterin phosphate synthase
MQPEEIETIIGVASSLGIDKIKLTGGEPLLRQDLLDIVQRITPIIPNLSMTTNAALLAEKACELKEAGLQRVNISLHSLNPELFEKITCINSYESVEKGIKVALECGLNPVKLNMVVMKELNHQEIPDMIEFAKKTGTILQLIEFQELENGVEPYEELHYDLEPIEKMLKSRAAKIHEREMHRRKQYHLEGGGIVEVVRPMHNTRFCAHCNRLRLTSDGYLKPCLMREDNHVDIISLVRNRAPRTALIDAFKKAVSYREPYWRD